MRNWKKSTQICVIVIPVRWKLIYCTRYTVEVFYQRYLRTQNPEIKGWKLPKKQAERNKEKEKNFPQKYPWLIYFGCDFQKNVFNQNFNANPDLYVHAIIFWSSNQELFLFQVNWKHFLKNQFLHTFVFLALLILFFSLAFLEQIELFTEIIYRFLIGGRLNNSYCFDRFW